MRTNFKFESHEQKAQIFKLINSSLNSFKSKKELCKNIKLACNISANVRTIEGWIDEITLRRQNTKHNQLVKKWREEYQTPNEEIDPLLQLTEEVWTMAKVRG